MVFGRLFGRDIIVGPEHEPDHVRVLLDRARFTQVRQLRLLVLALFDGAAQLRKGHHRHVEFLGQLFQAAADLRDFLDAVVIAALAGALQQLEIVDDDHSDALLALEAAGTGAESRNRQTGSVVDVERKGR
jgi:hypothetical protein